MSNQTDPSAFLIRFGKSNRVDRPSTKSADDCGTGAGGFKEGNDCAAGDGTTAKPGSSFIESKMEDE